MFHPQRNELEIVPTWRIASLFCKYNFFIIQLLEKTKKDSPKEAEALIVVKQIIGCTKCRSKNSLCEIHSKLIKKIITHEYQKEQ